jgi:hypothetical protein
LVDTKTSKVTDMGKRLSLEFWYCCAYLLVSCKAWSIKSLPKNSSKHFTHKVKFFTILGSKNIVRHSPLT